MTKYYNSPRISSEYRDCSLPLTFDQSSLCSFGCLFCFATYQKTNNPSCKGKNNPVSFVNVERIKNSIEGKRPNDVYYQNFFKHRFPLHWGGLTDPFDSRELENGTTLQLIKILARNNYPTLFSSHGDLMAKSPYLEIFEAAKENKNFAFQFSITTNSDEMVLKLEPGTPSTTDRLKAMKTMSDMGYWTILRLRPFILDITDRGLADLVRRASEAGVRAISTEFFCLDVRMNSVLEQRYKMISELVGYDIRKFYRQLSPMERGGYFRLNRKIKAPIIEQLLRLCKQYHIQLNISDPDFKEINFHGSCCGLPAEQLAPGSGLHNWSRGQLTYFLSEMRKEFLATGQRPKLTFKQVLSKQANNWLEDKKYYGDSIKNFSQGFGNANMTFKYEFQQVWNNLRSAGNPFNYFHGKIKPVGMDEDKNIIFEYVPDQYEIYWHKEGLI